MTITERKERVIKTSVEEFLDLSPVDMQMIDLKVMLALKKCTVRLLTVICAKYLNFR